ncbi:MAG: hypothetical protein IAG10_01320 [Planctomycetaceae bacterium]|nr:hypothetical protein [Planctomycetaceae bacterium]
MSLRGLFVLAALWLVGCKQEVKVAFDITPPPPIETNFDRLPTVLAGIPKTGVALLYEGLPSDFWEPQLLEQELARTKTVRLHGYPFYEELLAWQGADGEQLTALLSARTSFATYTDGKKGGGFHANYCLEWKSSEGTTHVVISLEGGEVKMYVPKSELHCDLSQEAAQKLRQLLSPYRKNCPVETPSP